jgi:hypothetical protein
MFAALGRWTVSEEIFIIPCYGHVDSIDGNTYEESCNKKFNHLVVLYGNVDEEEWG